MRSHTANELIYTADIKSPDNASTLASGVACGLEDLTGQRLEQAQLVASVTSHMILMRTLDAGQLADACYVDIGGTLFVVDYILPPAGVRARSQWVEVYCHLERAGN